MLVVGILKERRQLIIRLAGSSGQFIRKGDRSDLRPFGAGIERVLSRFLLRVSSHRLYLPLERTMELPVGAHGPSGLPVRVRVERGRGRAVSDLPGLCFGGPVRSRVRFGRLGSNPAPQD